MGYVTIWHTIRALHCYLHNVPMTMHAIRMISYRMRWNTHDEDLKASYYRDPHRRALLSHGMFLRRLVMMKVHTCTQHEVVTNRYYRNVVLTL